MNYRVVLSTLGALLLFLAATMLAPLGISFFSSKSDFPAFLISFVFTAIAGALLWISFRKKKEIRTRDGFFIVTIAWTGLALFGALPMFLSGAIPSFTDAFFESMSGFTTTGASILNNIEDLPAGVLFWRSLTHWIGGMGIIVLSVAILPLLGVGGMQLFKAEVPGPITDKLTPRIIETARILWVVYVLFTAAETLLLWLGGMTVFDSLCHSFGTMATGGFSTKQASIGHYSSPYIEYVVIVFMFLAGTSFTLHFHAFRGKFKNYLKSIEFRFYCTAIAISTVVLMLGLEMGSERGFELIFRESLFQVLAMITTTGYGTADFVLWPALSQFIILMLMVMGGMAGSTGGGMKVIRIQLLMEHARLEFRKLLHPRGVFRVRLGDRTVSEPIISQVLSFLLLYLLMLILGTIIMTFLGLDLVTAGTSVIAALSNIGPGLGDVGPASNYAAVAPLGKWVLSFFMLLGRLEIYTVLVIFSRGFWRA